MPHATSHCLEMMLERYRRKSIEEGMDEEALTMTLEWFRKSWATMWPNDHDRLVSIEARLDAIESTTTVEFELNADLPPPPEKLKEIRH